MARIVSPENPGLPAIMPQCRQRNAFQFNELRNTLPSFNSITALVSSKVVPVGNLSHVRHARQMLRHNIENTGQFRKIKCFYRSL